ncbi:cilia- and flagella-associated protein 61-like isoform X4 [Maniola jurtina]|uniref:cilia- and flagella-associated protein 61-like isoform X4 n=1 Tax=Maniola jurtina TaxID=191418 RepID=UPI001E68EFAD|nr:cilia- and flagella-associated protein 61-like isoform X4 [Maniola jurtina]
MSIFFDFNVGPSGRRFRRAVDGDKSDIESIINRQHTDCLFGTPDIGSLIEFSTLSICMVNENKQVTGFMALCDHPNIVGVDPADWELWIRNMFQKYYLSRNTLFIHFMCCIDAATDTFLEDAFVSVFRNDVYLLNIVIVVPRDCPADWTTRYKTFKRYNIYKFYPEIEGSIDRSLYIHTAMRQNFCPKLKIRRAVEEDNDDIVEMLGKNCPALQELYGNYYISEIIGRHPEMGRKIIVADYQDQAVGVMCLSSKINYEMLQKTYELGPYHGLKKATPIEKENYKRSNALLKTFGMPIMLGKWSPFKVISKQDFIKPDNEPSKGKPPHKRAKGLSRVNFECQTEPKERFDNFFSNQTSEDYSEKELISSAPSALTCLSVTNLLDDDPFDYEIVNIDDKLLNVPEVLSSEFLLSQIRRDRSQRSHTVKTEDKRNRKDFVQRSSMLRRPTYEEEELVAHSAGDPNAFVIELFGLREDIDDRQSFHLLETAFEIMKEYDYCIIRVPCKEKSFHLLEHFCFVPTRRKINSEYALYVAHRNSVLSKLRVRKAELIDIPQITQLLRNLDGRETLWTVENTILNRNHLQCYVFLSGVSLIGVGILEQPEHIDFIRAKYNMDCYRINKYHINEDHHNNILTIKSCLVYPVFEAHSRFFARDMMRLSGANALLWLTAYRNRWVIHKTNSLAGAMIPLIPRKSQIDCTLVPELRRIRELLNTVMPFSAWFVNKKLSSVPRVNVDTRILVVGASRTAIAFLNALLFSDTCPYLFFTSVTLVSSTGLPYARRTKAISEMMFQKNRTNSEDYLKSVPFTYYVNIVQGTMVEINRRKKYIAILNGSKYYYDLLFLFIGKQYQHPHYMKPILEREKEIRSGRIPKYIRLDIPHPSPEPKVGNATPSNVFIVNTISDANKALNVVKTLTYQDTDYNIIVYGATLHAYCCLATLLEMKVPPENIIFIEPFPPEDSKEPRVSLFCNVNVDKSVSEMLNNLKIKVYRSYYFQRWYTDNVNLVVYIDFLSHFHMLKLKCSLFFYYGTIGVNEEAYIAINKSGMAYDDGILIDHKFKTKDPSIYAAGTATRYRRKYYADNMRLKYYDANEVGTKLGYQIKNQLDPLFKEVRKEPGKLSKDTTQDISSGSSKTVKNKSVDTERSVSEASESLENIPKIPVFKKPHVSYCSLPGGLQYLEVRSSGKKMPHQYVQSLQYNGIVMETFKGGYFKLHLINDLIVDGITCLTREMYSLENFKNLYGLSATVLNNVHLRYTAKKLDDFYTFFRAPWAYFLYHDQADELFAMVKELLPKGNSDGDTLEEAMRAVGEILSDPFHTKLKIRSTFDKSPHVEAITDYVIEWLSENDVLLPMYLQPFQTNYYNQDLDHNSKIDDPLPERVSGRDMVVEKESYKTTTGEYCVKPNPNKAMERSDCAINCRRVIFMTGVEKRLQGKNIVQPVMISEMKDNFRGVVKPSTAPPDIVVKPPDPEYIFDVIASGRNEAPAISDSAGGFRKLLDPYVSTYRTYHKPFTVEEQFGIGAKDQITFYSEFNLPKVRGFGPRHKEIWMPLTAKVHRGVYDRIHVKKEYKEVAACHNPVNNIKGVFESETKKKYKVPFAISPLASWDHGEMFDLAPYPPNPYQTDIAPFMYCSDYCHIAQGTPPYTVIDQLKHNLKPRQKCVERFIVSRDFAP